MALLSVQDVWKSFADTHVLQGVSLAIAGGEHVSLIGLNGSGKSTLLSIVAGNLPPDKGQVVYQRDSTAGMLVQRIEWEAQTTVWQAAEQAVEPVLQLLRSSDQVADEISRCPDPQQRQTWVARFDQLQVQIDNRGGWHLDRKIERVLAGLGFDPGEFDQPIGQLSGGQQSRVMLARLLLEEPDLMLLDEPSNHLDLTATEWLEDFLSRSRQAFILVSHDRYLLDRVSQRTLELADGQATSFPGNYTQYRQLKAEQELVQGRALRRQRGEVQRLEEFVRRHHYGQKAAQAKDREKKLQRIQLAAPPRQIQEPPMELPCGGRSGDVVLRAEQLAVGFDSALIQHLTFQIQRGERWALHGPNGCGKTTLLRCLVGQLSPLAGRLQPGAGVHIGYFDQLLDSVPDDRMALEAVRPAGQLLDEQARRALLARFGIVGDQALQPLGQLSGGERSRVMLARLAALQPNFLVLDEPTNHLDLWARQALERALLAFAGTVLLVSHDRYFLNRVCDHLLVIESATARVIEGNYDTYLALQAHSQPAAGPAKGRTAAAPAREKSRRKRRFPYRKVEEIESDIQHHESLVQKLHADLANPEWVRHGQRVVRAQSELREHQQALERLYLHLEEAIEMN